MELRSVIKSAGMSVEEFAGLAGVTRAVVYRWEQGRGPHELRRERIVKLLNAVSFATSKGLLPVKISRCRSSKFIAEKRDTAIRAAVVAALRQL